MNKNILVIGVSTNSGTIHISTSLIESSVQHG
jgi:hypothetical protein